GPARAEGTVGRDLLLQPGQSEHRPPAAGAGAEGLSANARDPRDALLAGRGELLRGQGGGGQRTAPPPVRGIRVHRVGPAGQCSPAGSKVIAVHDIVDLRSDTLTLPTPEMREAMARAQVGDDVWEEDPTVQRLEAMSAECLGKEAGLFVASGTMGNLVSVLSHTQAGQEVVLDLDSHIFNYEVAGAAVIGSVQMRPVKTARGFLAPVQVREALRPPNIHIPPTGLVCVENTHNRSGGTCCTPEEIGAVAAVAHGASVPVHLDGARLFNAVVALKRPAREFARDVDSVTFCVSKGLAAPVGSVICGSGAFITRARRVRKMPGGGLRQARVIAAAGLAAPARRGGRPPRGSPQAGP